MDWASKELVSIIYYLLPGFLAAWIFHGLTAHQKAAPFERVVQALIFTVITQGITSIVRWSLVLGGRWVVLGEWSDDVGLVWSLLTAASIGTVVAGFTNNDTLHAWLRNRRWNLRRRSSPAAQGKREWTWTRRTSHPSEWFSAFMNHNSRYVILHLNDSRRVFGFLEEWPDQPDRGHFLIGEAEWLLSKNERAPVYGTEVLLIPAVTVVMVEFMKWDWEINVSEAELQRAESLLLSAQNEEGPNGQQSTAIAPRES